MNDDDGDEPVIKWWLGFCQRCRTAGHSRCCSSIPWLKQIITILYHGDDDDADDDDFDDGHENGDDAVGNDDDDDDGSQGSVGVHGTVAAHRDVSQSQLSPTSL